MCLQIEAEHMRAVDHVKVEVSSANNSIWMCFAPSYSRVITSILLISLRSFLF